MPVIGQRIRKERLVVTTPVIKGADPWFANWANRIPFPLDHVVVDLATSGTDSRSDLIVAADLQVSRLGVVTDRLTLTLDWTQEPSLDQDALRQRLQTTADALSATGRTYPYTWDMLAMMGDAPRACLTLLVELLERQPAATMLVGHGVWSFQLPFLTAQVSRWLGRPFCWPGERCLDTGLIEKARQMNELPAPGEPLTAFWNRLANAHAAGVRWNHAHCAEQYGLSADSHDEGYLFAQRLLEAFRRCAEIDYAREGPCDDDVDPFALCQVG